jgi:hypothetical protein
MGRARAALELSATADAVERLWADPTGWAAFVDGFERVVELDPSWPEPGARLVWASHPGGRGRVTEKVVSRVPGAELVVEQEDDQLSGLQRLAFAPVDGLGADGRARVGVALELDYALLRKGPFMVVADPLFVRRALRDSLRRTLERLGRELA